MMCAVRGSTTLHVVGSLSDYNVCRSSEYHSPCCEISQTIMCAGPGSTTLHVVRSLSDYNVCWSREYHSLCILKTPFVNIKENKERKKHKHCDRYKMPLADKRRYHGCFVPPPLMFDFCILQNCSRSEYP